MLSKPIETNLETPKHILQRHIIYKREINPLIMKRMKSREGYRIIILSVLFSLLLTPFIFAQETNETPCTENCTQNQQQISTLLSTNERITLISPEDGYKIEESKELTFTYRVQKSYEIASCSLFFNDKKAVTTSSRIQSRDNLLKYLVPEGEYEWHLTCVSRDGKKQYKSSSRSLIVGNPVKNLILEVTAPENNFTLTGTQEVHFSFNLPVELAIDPQTKCLLKINGEEKANYSNSEPMENSSRTLSNTLAPGIYEWSVSCNNEHGDNASSEVQTLQVKSPPSQEEQDSGQGSSSGGGGGLIFEPKKKTSPIPKPSSTPVSSPSSAPTPNQTPQQTSEEITDVNTETPGITGAVIGKMRSLKILPIIIFISLILGAMVFLYIRKKEQNAINKMISETKKD